MIRIREAAVAGSFYPAEPAALLASVRALLSAVPADAGPAPTALVVPHAGYAYSGPVAASAYARLAPHANRFHRVILLGPCHRVALRGIAGSAAERFRTPLGDVPVDREALAAVRHPALSANDAAHAAEHSLEVQLPFLQAVLGDFTLVPLVVGTAAASTVCEVLEAFWTDAGSLPVVSSDLSHYLPYDDARRLDRATGEAIERLDERRLGPDAACGAAALGGLLIAARRRGLQVRCLDLRNSGDTSGDRRRVVGYGAWLFSEEARCERAA